MLPDWPAPKLAILKLMNLAMQARAHGMSIAAVISHKPVFEGHANSIRRADGSFEESEFHAASGEAQVPVDIIKSGNLDAVLMALAPVSEQVGAEVGRSMLETIEAGIRAVGNEVDAAGRPLTAELILDALDKIWVNFDEAGNPRWPTFFGGSAAADRAKVEFARIENEPALAKRLEEITERKREEWRAREASRVLVG